MKFTRYHIELAYANGVRGFSGLDLSGAALFRADLSGANLSGAYLSRADLFGAYLSGANLSGANLFGANLSGANLSGANLSGAALFRADLSGANLSGAYLSGANLSGAYLSGADLFGANLSPFQIVPREGSFVAYKKLRDGVIATLQIPTKAKRTSSLTGRKCRAQYVKVLRLSKGKTGKAQHDGTIYTVGKIVQADKWDGDIRVECTNGIHFFMTKEEAENY